MVAFSDVQMFAMCGAGLTKVFEYGLLPILVLWRTFNRYEIPPLPRSGSWKKGSFINYVRQLEGGVINSSDKLCMKA